MKVKWYEFELINQLVLEWEIYDELLWFPSVRDIFRHMWE